VAQADLWRDAEGSAVEFVRLALEDWLDGHGRQSVAKNFFLDVSLSDRVDPTSWFGGEIMAEPRELYVSVQVESAAYVIFGPSVRLLARIHPRLPATFYRGFVGSLERWVRVYDHRDALERVEQMQGWIADESPDEYEMPDVEGALPAALKRKALSRRTMARLVANHRRTKGARLLAGLVHLMACADRAARPALTERAQEQLEDSNPAVPALLAVIEENDAVEACFNEEAQTMLEMPPEPNVVLPFDGLDPDSVTRAFRQLACLTETLAAASELIEQMPGNERAEETRA
jgi:hypothetical protein